MGTFPRYVFVVVLGVGLSGCTAANLPPPSSFMPQGAQASPPIGYLSFCERFSDQCAPTVRRSGNAVALSSGDGYAKNNYNSYYGAAAFANIKPASADWGRTQPRKRAPDALSESFDWHNVFKIARAGGTNPADNATSTPRTVAPDQRVGLTPKLWQQLQSVNDFVNTHIRARSDYAQYGVADYWNLPLESGTAQGDCEDYALEKRRALLALDVPMSALSVALVQTAWHDDHAVLLVHTTQGDYVLDSLSPWILPWTDVSYTWLEWENGANPGTWVRAAAN